MTDVFGRGLGDDRLEVEISAALAERVHRRARASRWSGRVGLVGAAVLAIIAVAVLVIDSARGASLVLGLTVTAVALLAAVAAVVVARAASVRTGRLLESSAPEGGIVLGVSSAGVQLAHLPLLEWSVVTAVCIADARGPRVREVVVGLAVLDVEAARARVIDARLTHLVRPFPRGGPPRRGLDSTLPGFLTVELGDLLDDAAIDGAIERLDREATERDLPVCRVSDRRRLVAVLRDRSSPSRA